MTKAVAPERQFAVFDRGEIREQILGSWRNWLRTKTNPETGAIFSELECAIATARGGRWWAEADAIDLVFQAGQARALFMADQFRARRAATPFLENEHGRLWTNGKLPATGGGGPADAPAPVGTVFVGSTTIPNPAAHQAIDAKGRRYQVLTTVVTPGSGVAALTFQGIDTGEETNRLAGDLLTWSSGPLGATEPVTVTTDFTGGTPAETDPEFAKRIEDTIRHKQGAGNDAQTRGWAREASNAVEDAFVYACAQHAGSTVICVLTKRKNVLGPLARIASAGVISRVTTYMVPPASPVYPTPPHVLVCTATATSSDLVLGLSMPAGTPTGWTDLVPWPAYASAIIPAITVLTNQTHFRMTAAVALPSGVTAPSLMVWNDVKSQFEKLFVSSVVTAGVNLWDVVLSAPPAKTLVVGDRLSPLSARLATIAKGVEDYFDSLGPGELVDLATDLRASRAYRFPEPVEDFPQRAGAAIIGRLGDALGPSLTDGTLDVISATAPAVPADPSLGPALLVCGKVAVYAF